MTAVERTPAPSSTALSDGAARIAAALRRSVVAVGDRRGRGGIGAGTVWRPGLVVTNDHVARAGRSRPEIMRVEPAAEAPSAEPLETAPLAPFEARVLARDPRHDLAALEVPVSAALPAVETRNAASLRAGELVVAVGHPWGERGAFSAGVVLTTGEPAREHAVPLAETVRADLRLAPGNAGGPLAEARGGVVGVNAMIAGGSAVAVPSEAVERFLARLRASGDGSAAAAEHRPGFLGIAARAVAPGDAGAAGDGAALLLTEVVAGSPAEATGLLPGDVLLAIGEARGLEAMTDALRRIAASRPLRLELLRGGRPLAVELQPGEPPQAWPWSA